MPWQLSADGHESGRRRLSLPDGFEQIDDDEVTNPTTIPFCLPRFVLLLKINDLHNPSAL